MPEYSYRMMNGQQVYDDPKARAKYLAKKKDGEWGLEIHRTPRGAKTDPQMGYYWGFLVIKIMEELPGQGIVKTLGTGEHEFPALMDKDDTHEWLKKHCAKVSDDGEYVTYSEQDRYMNSRYITNVLWLAEYWLGMNVEALAATRPNLDERK